jgi:hypothetical protein
MERTIVLSELSLKHACDLSTWEVEAGGPKEELKGSLVYVVCLKPSWPI